jgi:hypothetical protein
MHAFRQAGRIRAHVERFPLKDVQRAYDSLRAGRLNGRAVVIPREAACLRPVSTAARVCELRCDYL